MIHSQMRGNEHQYTTTRVFVPKRSLGAGLLAFVALPMLLTIAVLGQDPGERMIWPDREWLLDSLVKAVPGILESQSTENGRFGSEPWICQDQNVIFPLAVAWASESANNPFFHDEQLLKAIILGGDALIAAQDAQGRWVFRKKDNSTWGDIHMPWTYSRWIRAFALIREKMPETDRTRWETALHKGFSHIRRYADGRVHNIPTHHAMALYIAGTCFNESDWQEAARDFMAKVVEEQDTDGFWSENFGPVVGYNQVYVEALGIYYAASGDATVLPALQRSARFHANFLWPDGSPIAAIDERQVYHATRSIGNVGFSHTALGRGYLVMQTEPLRTTGKNVSADYAASMLIYGGKGPAKMPPVRGDRGRFVLGQKKALVERDKPWQFCFSAYSCPVPRNRWIQDRQNVVDVFHDNLGLIIGGGNTKLQPYWSTFTVGDPETLKHQEGDESPDFRPNIPLRWVPTRSLLLPDSTPPTLELHYHTDIGRVSANPMPDGSLALTYSAELTSGDPMEAHIPILKRTGRIRFASGKEVFLGSEPVELGWDETGDSLEWNGLHMTIPEGARLKWPCRQHNPYAKDGRAPLGNAKLVMILPFSAERSTYNVVLGQIEEAPFDGIVFAARSLQSASPTGTRIKQLDDLQSVFLGATRNGESMTFTLPLEQGGRYELLADFVIFPGYGIVQLSVDGQEVGTPFDAYAPELDSSGPVSFGTIDLAAGPHTLALKIVGKNPDAVNRFISIRSFMLVPGDE